MLIHLNHDGTVFITNKQYPSRSNIYLDVVNKFIQDRINKGKGKEIKWRNSTTNYRYTFERGYSDIIQYGHCMVGFEDDKEIKSKEVDSTIRIGTNNICPSCLKSGHIDTSNFICEHC